MFGRYAPCPRRVFEKHSIHAPSRLLSSNAALDRFHGFELVIGLEVHAQIKSRAKLFSHAWSSKYDEQINSHVDVFDAAFPGTLPKLNKACVDLAVRTAFALGSQVQRTSSFDRKHYVYSDLPSGYQITQHYAPLSLGGFVTLPYTGAVVKIQQIQLEQDTAKSTHQHEDSLSFIDLNRAGSALMEIVSEPDMRSPEQAAEYLKVLRALLRSVGSSDGNMEEGSLRCDANVSVNKPGSPRGTRCEIKNLNSIKFASIAITNEAHRHISIINSGGQVKAETRGFDEHRAETFFLRSKEDTPDYRYMPDPNLPPLILSNEYLNRILSNMPETQVRVSERLLKLGLSPKDTDLLLSLDAGRDIGLDGQINDGILAYYEAVADGRDPKTALNWVLHELHGILVGRNKAFVDNPLSVTHMRELIDLVNKGKLTSTSAKILLKYMVENDANESPEHLAEKLSLLALDVEGKNFSEEVQNLCLDTINALPNEAQAVRAGNKNVINKLLGYAIKKSNGRANANAIRAELQRILLEGRQ